MTIRTRLNLWYAVILIVSMFAFGFGTYHEIAEQLQHHQPDDTPLGEADEMIFRVGLPAILFGLAGGWLLTRKALAPVTALTRTAQKINDRNLGGEIPRSGNGDELDRLTEVFNEMTKRLDGSFQRIREFTLHASHELKTPLTVLHGELETALNEEKLSATQRDRIASQLDEIQRLTKIVDGLTLLTKADAGQVALQAETLSFDEVVRDVFDDAQMLARPAQLTVTLSKCEPLQIQGDRRRLRQLLLNLADNAIKYNLPGGTVDFSLRRDGQDAELNVSNTGRGIPPEILPRVFDRFYRGDASHNSDVDGCGLGLSIAKWIVSAHQGSIQVESVQNQLTTVTVRLPVKP